jgi:predicted nucleic acid-binding protein
MIRIALDSNILIYFADLIRVEADRAKSEAIRAMLAKLQDSSILIVPVQALGEMFYVLRRNGVPPSEARDLVLAYEDTYETTSSNPDTLMAALDLAVDHKLQFWDSLILSAAAEAGCSLLLSEDMQDGFVTRGVTIANPFAEKLHPRLARLLT